MVQYYPVWSSKIPGGPMGPYCTTKDHIGSCKVLQGPVKSRLVTYCPVSSRIVPYCPGWSQMAPDCPVWSDMVLYGPVWSHVVLYGPIWSCKVPYGTVWSLQSCMVPYGPWFGFVTLILLPWNAWYDRLGSAGLFWQDQFGLVALVQQVGFLDLGCLVYSRLVSFLWLVENLRLSFFSDCLHV